MEEIMKVTEKREFVNKELAKATKEIDALGDKIRESYFKVAAKIAAVDSSECYKEDGFSSVHEWTETVWGWKKTRSYELLNIGREWTSTILDKNGKVVGYCSDINPAYTTSQVAALIPAGHAAAVDLDAEGAVSPAMSVKKIKAVVSALLKGTETEEPETEEPETEEAETAENETLIRVTDENGVEYEIPESVLAKYRVD